MGKRDFKRIGLIAEKAPEKRLDNVAEAAIDHKQHDKCQYKEPEKANDNFQDFEKQPKCQ